MKFKAVAYGDGSDALRLTAENLNGEFVETILATQLANAFISLVARKKKNAPALWDGSKLEVGQMLSMTTYYHVTAINGNTITVQDQNESTINVSKNVIDKMASGTHFAKEVPLNMTGLAEILEECSDTVFTACFHKQPTVENAVELLEKTTLASLNDPKVVN